MIFAWWMAVLADGYSSAYFRKKPMLCVVASWLSFRWKSPKLTQRLFTGMMMTMILTSIRLLLSPLRIRQILS